MRTPRATATSPQSDGWVDGRRGDRRSLRKDAPGTTDRNVEFVNTAKYHGAYADGAATGPEHGLIMTRCIQKCSTIIMNRPACASGQSSQGGQSSSSSYLMHFWISSECNTRYT